MATTHKDKPTDPKKKKKKMKKKSPTGIRANVVDLRDTIARVEHGMCMFSGQMERRLDRLDKIFDIQMVLYEVRDLATELVMRARMDGRKRKRDPAMNSMCRKVGKRKKQQESDSDSFGVQLSSGSDI